MITTTLEQLKKDGVCKIVYRRISAHLPVDWKQDCHIPIEMIVKSNGLYDALWAVSISCKRSDIAVEFARWCSDEARKCASYVDGSDQFHIVEQLAIGVKYASMGVGYVDNLSGSYALAVDAACDTARCAKYVYGSCDDVIEKQKAKLIELCEEG